MDWFDLDVLYVFLSVFLSAVDLLFRILDFVKLGLVLFAVLKGKRGRGWGLGIIVIVLQWWLWIKRNDEKQRDLLMCEAHVTTGKNQISHVCSQDRSFEKMNYSIVPTLQFNLSFVVVVFIAGVTLRRAGSLSWPPDPYINDVAGMLCSMRAITALTLCVCVH